MRLLASCDAMIATPQFSPLQPHSSFAMTHDPYLVALAALICLFSCYTALTLMGRARDGVGARSGHQTPRETVAGWSSRWGWCAAAATVAGCGTWATHFVAMLSWFPGVQVGYDVTLTILSITLAICGAGVGMSLAAWGVRRFGSRASALGGAITGGSMAGMHFVGMMAIYAPAHLTHAPSAVVISIALSVGLATVAFLLIRKRGLSRRISGTLVLMTSILGLHFTAMAGLTVHPDPTLALPAHVIAPRSLAVAVAAVTLMIVTFGFVGSILDQHLASRSRREARRLRGYIAELEATQRELRATTRDLSAALEAAAAASQAKSHFLAAMSHELRTPLNAVIGFADLMISEAYGPLGDERYREYTGIIRDSGSHLLSLINDVLDLSKLDANRLDLSEDVIDVRRMLAGAARMVSADAEKSNLTMTCELPGEDVFLRADTRRIRQIVLNLLSNAVKFTPAGGSIEVTAGPRGAGFEISVTDTGIGIAVEDIPIALERFGQIDSAFHRRYEGTGLGLPLAKRLMELHGGTLELASTFGTGTQVTCVFPASRVLSRGDALRLTGEVTAGV
ncbi:histidine kinase [Skermanella stibiiresistens SB22]|uniref:histidine kinase n=1 Tax=Skermanella stibiiresistens SB22 TaxID=1385369 RepID=W9HBJ6_9PROT|nr:ATP-binding protein [Skermanella stibiiresistens]EWY42082.1 histidine kinase [Skermanella stibiiresistens SB22]